MYHDKISSENDVTDTRIGAGTRWRVACIYTRVFADQFVARKFSRQAQRKHCKRLLISCALDARARAHTSIHLPLYFNHSDGHCSLKISSRTTDLSRRVVTTRKQNLMINLINYPSHVYVTHVYIVFIIGSIVQRKYKRSLLMKLGFYYYTYFNTEYPDDNLFTKYDPSMSIYYKLFWFQNLYYELTIDSK